MNFTQYLYPDFFSVGAFIPAVFAGLLAYFFVMMKNKSRSSVFMTRFMVMTTLFFLSYFFAAIIDHPLAAYHRWGTVATCLIGEIFMGLAVLNFPNPRFPRFEKYYLIFWYAVCFIIAAVFFYETVHVQKIFNFQGHYWDFYGDKSGKIYAMLLIVSILLIMILGIVRAIFNKGIERWAVLAMGVSISLAFMVPGILNLMSRDGLIDRGIYQISQNLATITGLFIGVIIFFNTTKDRSNFMSKILIVVCATILIIIQAISYLSLQEQEHSYDRLISRDAQISQLKGTYPDSMKYMVTYNLEKNTVAPLYTKNNTAPDIDFSVIDHEFYNTFMYAKISGLDKNNFMENLSGLFEKTDPRFEGYRDAIIKFASSLPAGEPGSSAKVISYINSIERSVLATKTKISQIDEKNFTADLKKFLPGARTKIFNEAIHKYINAEKSGDQRMIKNYVLTYLAPLKSEGSRIYRKDASRDGRYVAVMNVDLKAGTVTEAGYEYLDYRKYVSGTSAQYHYILLVIMLVLFVGFPFFFWGSLVKPVKNLLSGIKQMQQGNLKVQIPVRFEDEFGYMSRTFNDMAVKINEATENLEDKVKARTEELQAAMEEMEAMNEQLVEARDALWGEMELAKKIQTKLLPVDPEIADYDISAYMQPADEVGGDYYDIINAAGIDWIVIGDVSGHGVPAGLVMMMTQTAIHVVLAQNPDIAPDRLLDIVNATISDNIKRLGEDKYMTISVLAATVGGKFIFSGLHQDIMIFRAATGKVDLIETRGMWIGIVDDIKGMLDLDSLSMSPGDTMLLYSDGITEAVKEETAKSADHLLFGDVHLADLFKKSASLPVDGIKDAILKDLKGYNCGDDVTMVILKRKV